MEISVNSIFTDRTYTIKCEPNDTIASVKARMQALEGTPVSQQCLTNGEQALQDGRTLSDYNIVKRSLLKMVTLRLSMEITVENYRGDKITLNAEGRDSVEDLKAMIQDKEGTPSEEQKLFVRGCQLENGVKLGQYNVNKEKKMHILLKVDSDF